MSYAVPIPSSNCAGKPSVQRPPLRLSSTPPTPPTVPRTMRMMLGENNSSEDIFVYAVRYISEDRGRKGHGAAKGRNSHSFQRRGGEGAEYCLNESLRGGGPAALTR